MARLSSCAIWRTGRTSPACGGNGATFDVTILDSAYQRGGGESPWPFYAARDMRTIVDLAERLRGFDKKSVERIGVHHEAADDAAHQARVISAAYAALKG